MSSTADVAATEAPHNRAGASIFLLFSRKWIRLLGFRFPVWAHVGVLLVDRASPRATFYDVVSARPRSGKGAS